MKKLYFLFLLSGISMYGVSQSIIGSWQLVKQSTCVGDELSEGAENEKELVSDLKSMNDKTPEILRFKDNQNADESTHIIYKSKVSNTRNFMYKFDGNNLYILDKKSHTLVSSYTVESAPADSLILSNSSRPCETKVFIRVK